MTDDGQERVYELWLGHELISYPYSAIKADPQLERDLKMLERKKAECELAFFHPHGEAKKGYDCGFDLVSMADWINDRSHSVYMNCSPNKVGKTVHAIVKILLKIIPCDPRWEIFKNGIKYHDWQGPRTMVAFGYTKDQLKDDLWPALQTWVPANELGAYRPRLFQEMRTPKIPSWDRGPRVELTCGSKIILLTYDQDAGVCCGTKATEVLANEQMPLQFFWELSQRGRNIEGGMTFVMPYTPHKVEGRADTGASSFLTDMWKGVNTRGHTILRTRISVDDVPDQIYPKQEKIKAYRECVEVPRQTGDQEAIRQGEARYYGIAQQISGLFYPEIDRDIHYVDWTWDDIKSKPKTCYRSMDYGMQNPTACGQFAVFPSGDILMFDEYYRAGMDAVSHAPAIIEHCGNERRLVGEKKDKNSGARYDVYEEVETRQKYFRTWLDWHSFQTAGGVGRPVSFFFQIGGLKVCESSKLGQEARAQNLRALLKIDPNRKHLVTGKPGAPRIYFSRKCVKMMWEFERCVVDTRVSGGESHNLKEVKRNVNDHLVDACEYFACASPKYLGDYSNRGPKELPNTSRHGGY